MLLNLALDFVHWTSHWIEPGAEFPALDCVLNSLHWTGCWIPCTGLGAEFPAEFPALDHVLNSLHWTGCWIPCTGPCAEFSALDWVLNSSALELGAEFPNWIPCTEAEFLILNAKFYALNSIHWILTQIKLHKSQLVSWSYIVSVLVCQYSGASLQG